VLYFWWSMWGWGGVSPNNSVWACQEHYNHFHLHLHFTFTRRTNTRSLGTLKKALSKLWTAGSAIKKMYDQYSDTNVMRFLLHLLRIKCLHMFRALLAHLQKAQHKRHLVYCVHVMSVGCTRMHAIYKAPFV
jgi:hypothetical protein